MNSNQGRGSDEHNSRFNYALSALGILRAALDKKSISTPVSLALGSRIAIFSLLLLYIGLFPVPIERKPTFFDAVRTWDGNHYIAISEHGYIHNIAERQTNTTFFPLYPLLGSIFGRLIGNIPLALFLISNFCFVIYLIYLYKLVEMDFDDDTASRTVLYVCLYPASFFFSCLYAESICLALVTAAFYYARSGRINRAIAFASISTLTRLVAACIFFPVAWETLNRKRLRLKSLTLVACIPLTMSLYPIYLWCEFGDPLAFVNSMVSAWESGITWPWGTLQANLDFLVLQDSRHYNYAMTVVSFKMMILFFVLIAASIKIAPPAYWLYSIPLYFVSTTPSYIGDDGNIPAAGMLRYMMAIFPAFIVLARAGKNPYVHHCVIFLFGVLLGIFSMYFFCTYWIS